MGLVVDVETWWVVATVRVSVERWVERWERVGGRIIVLTQGRGRMDVEDKKQRPYSGGLALYVNSVHLMPYLEARHGTLSTIVRARISSVYMRSMYQSISFLSTPSRGKILLTYI